MSGAQSVSIGYTWNTWIPVLHMEYVVIHVFQPWDTAYASMGMLSEVLSVEVLNYDIHIIMCLY